MESQPTCLTFASSPVLVVAGHAGLVRGGVSRQREKRRHHVGAVRHGDPEGDRHQQPPAPPQAAPGHPGDGVPHQPLRTTHLPNRECSMTHTDTRFQA